jgi:signal transduction histidine kinase
MNDRPEPDAEELAALKRENAILRETLDSIVGTVVVYDAQRRFVLGNRAYHEHFPHLPPDDELAGKLFEDVLGLSIDAGTVVDPEALTDRTGFIARRAREMMHVEAPSREIYDPRTGRWYLILAKLTPSGSRVTLRVDIDEQKRLQRELEAARRAAEAASRAKSLFLANISHELRTPLNAVINFASLIKDQIHGSLGAAPYLEYAQSIHESGLHLLALIEELLELVSAEAGRLTLAEQPVNLRAVIHSVCRLLQPEAAGAGVTLIADVANDLPSVRGDGTRLRQILFNLLTNAIKFCRSGDTVRASAELTGDGRLSISIADTGPGIATDDLPRILRPFERAADRLGREVPGLGLGLPLVSHLVALHGSELKLESAPGSGTTASFSLPADRVLLQPTAAA